MVKVKSFIIEEDGFPEVEVRFDPYEEKLFFVQHTFEEGEKNFFLDLTYNQLLELKTGLNLFTEGK